MFVADQKWVRIPPWTSAYRLRNLLHLRCEDAVFNLIPLVQGAGFFLLLLELEFFPSDHCSDPT